MSNDASTQYDFITNVNNFILTKIKTRCTVILQNLPSRKSFNTLGTWFIKTLTILKPGSTEKLKLYFKRIPIVLLKKRNTNFEGILFCKNSVHLQNQNFNNVGPTETQIR